MHCKDEVPWQFQDSWILWQITPQLLDKLDGLVTLELYQNWEVSPEIALVVQSDQQSIQPLHKLGVLITAKILDM